MSKLIKLITLVLFASSLTLVSAAGYADKGGNSNGGGQGKGHDQGQGNNGKSPGNMENSSSKNRGQDSKTVGSKAKIGFSDNDRSTIINYFNTNPLTVTSLPPGIAKNLARGKPLPPGIAKKMLPPPLLPLLPTYPGYQYLLAGRDVLLVNMATGIVADILTNFLQ